MLTETIGHKVTRGTGVRGRMYPPPMLVACTVSVECRTSSRLAKGRGVTVRAGG